MLFRPMLRPRRPLLGAAMLGGAYAIGKRQVRAQMREQIQEPWTNLESENAAEAGPGAAPAAAAPAAPAAPTAGPDLATKLTELKALLDQGALTQAEFDTAKQKLLAA